MFKMMEKINLQTNNSDDFLRILGEQVEKIILNEDELERRIEMEKERVKDSMEEPETMSIDIWELTKFAHIQETSEDEQHSSMENDDIPTME